MSERLMRKSWLFLVRIHMGSLVSKPAPKQKNLSLASGIVALFSLTFYSAAFDMTKKK